MAKTEIDIARLELLIRGAEPEGINEVAFVICYAGGIMNEPIINIATSLRDRLDIDKLDTTEWKYLFLGLVMGDKDFRDSIADKDNQPLH